MLLNALNSRRDFDINDLTYEQQEHIYTILHSKFARHDNDTESTLQSQDEPVIPDTTSDTLTQDEHMNVTFDDSNKEDAIIYGPPVDQSFFSTKDEVSDIARFLERPVQLFLYSWTESGFGEATFSPWNQFFGDARVQKKIDNFYFINCKLHLKFVVNCSPFLYGAAYMSYRPFLYRSENLGSTVGREVGLSQRPGFWIYPQDNATYEMELPFFWLRDWIQITRTDDFTSMGKLILKQYTALTSANGAVSSGVTITCFAHATDVHLSTPTISASLQSKDEYGNGPVSSVASAVAKAAGSFVKTPIIGPYAKATEIGARATSQIAKIFGFTNVPVIDNPTPVKNMPFPHMASVHGSEPVQKMTLDPKAELTVDSRTAGLDGTDEMTIPSIVMRKSYLTSFTWETSDVADTLKMNIPVIPNLNVSAGFTGGSSVSFTPMSHVAEMFNNWRGDIEFTFKVVCSKFHRGRLRFTWDPIGPVVSTPGYNSTNVTYTKIVDIGEETEVSIRVPYMQAKRYLETYTAAAGALNLVQTSSFSDYTNPVSVPTRYNGQLTVRVLNVLSAPIDTSSVVVQLFVRGCENLEFANPRSIDNRYSYFNIQSSDEIVPTRTDDTHNNLICYGESFNSLRSVLRRSTFLEGILLSNGDSNTMETIVQMKFKKFPWSPGYNLTSAPYNTTAKGVVDTANNYFYTFCHMTPLAWMAGAYLGRRGAITHRFYLDSNNTNLIKSIRFYRTLDTVPHTAGRNSGSIATGSSNSFIMQKMVAYQPNGFEGVIQFDNLTQPGISIELPQYTNNRFEICDPTLGNVGSSIDNSDRETYMWQAAYNSSQVLLNTGFMQHFVSMGTDFTYLFYLNAPMMNLMNAGPGGVTPGPT